MSLLLHVHALLLLVFFLLLLAYYYFHYYYYIIVIIIIDATVIRICTFICALTIFFIIVHNC